MDPDVKSMDTLSPGRAAWRRAIDDPTLRDLPYRIETNEYGQLVMSPAKVRHSLHQGKIARMLLELVDQPGEIAMELGVDTPKGVKVPDVVWMSEDRWRQQTADADATEIAPEICVEVLSRSNTKAEIEEKRDLYLSCGADEVWTCDADGRMRFFRPEGEMPRSTRVPDFPDRIA